MCLTPDSYFMIVFVDILRKTLKILFLVLISWKLLNFQSIGSDGTSSDEENLENDRVNSNFDEDYPAFGWEDNIFNGGYRELDSDFFLKEPPSGIAPSGRIGLFLSGSMSIILKN